MRRWPRRPRAWPRFFRPNTSHRSPHHLQEELSEYAEATPEGNLIEVRDPQGEVLIGSAAWPPRRRRAALPDARQPRRRCRAGSYRIVVAAPLEGTELHAAPSARGAAVGGAGRVADRVAGRVLDEPQGAPAGGCRSRARRRPSASRIFRSVWKCRRRATNCSGFPRPGTECWSAWKAAVKRLSQFTADASHELRTPIALIRATAELTLRRERSAETYREALRHIIDEADRTARLIEDLLLLARADAGLPALPLDRVELTPLVRDVCEQGQILAQERQLEISTEAPEQPVYVDANDPALRRLLLLLVDNAVKYTPAGGHITVSVALDSSGPTVTVRDTGIGIPDAALPHVFERFYRVDESRNREAGGAGLGLSIAQWIAERHHARLEAESVVGQGSAFRVRFPQTQGQA